MNRKRVKVDIVIGVIISVLVLIDQITKHLAKIYLKPKTEDTVIIKKILALNYLQGGNQGAAWGMLSGKTAFLVIFTLIILCVVFIFLHNILVLNNFNYSLKKFDFFLLHLFLCLLIAGAIGNIIDRIRYGSVIDFICFRFISFPTFNVADIYVTVSCFFIVLLCVFKLSEEEFNEIFSIKRKGN